MMQFKKPPREHQRKSFEMSKDLPCWAAFWKVGTGKTWFAQMFIRWKWCVHGKMLPTLCVTVNRPVRGWRDEWLQNTNIDPKRVIIFPGGTSEKECIKIFGQACVKYGKEFVLVMTYRQLIMPNLFNAIQGWAPECIAIDESHKCKNHKAKRSKNLDELCNPARGWHQFMARPYIVELSGSSILKDPMDIFMQFKLLDGGRTFGTNPWIFRARYFSDRNAHIPRERKAPPKWELKTLEKDGVDAMEQLREKMNRFSNVIESGFDLPAEQDQTIWVEMKGEQLRVFNEMKKDAITFYKNGACTADLALTKLLRLAQIERGFIVTSPLGSTDREVRHFEDNTRVEALKEWLEEMLEQDLSVLIWAEHQENYAMIRKAVHEVFADLGEKYSMAECHGLVPKKLQDENLDRFRDDPNCRVFLGHPQSGGIGINQLKKAAVDITYSEMNNLENWIQKRGRNVRDGSKEMGIETVTHFTIMAKGGVSAKFNKNLLAKKDMSDNLLIEILNDLSSEDDRGESVVEA
jgi:hypothetical protein